MFFSSYKLKIQKLTDSLTYELDPSKWAGQESLSFFLCTQKNTQDLNNHCYSIPSIISCDF